MHKIITELFYVTAKAYIHNGLRSVLLPFIRQHFRNCQHEFKQHNVPAHIAVTAAAFLQRNQINVLDSRFPPNMLLIEHVCDD
jgi:hypothetical protein